MKNVCPARFVFVVVVAVGSILGTGLGSPAFGDTEYTPSVSLFERYDSNVFYSPKEFHPQDSQPWDLVTTLAGDLRILNKSRYGDTELRVGVAGNAYVFNPDLAYVSTNAFLMSDVSNWVHDLIPGLKLTISDAFLFTPEPPAFLTGGKPDQSDIFARGIQAYRANTFSNNLTADAYYPFTRSLGYRNNYTYSIFRVGQLFVSETSPTGSFAFFDSTIHTFATGPTYAFDGGDTLFMRYTYQTADTVDSSGRNPSITFTSHSLQPEYVARFARGWTATISGGATLVEQIGSKTFFSGKFALINDFDRRTRVSASVSRQTAPAFFVGGGALISNVAQLYLSHAITRVVRLNVSANYAYNESTPVKIFTIESIGGSAALEYSMTRSSKLVLSQEYGRWDISNTPTFDRYATMLMFRTEWK